MKRFTLALLVMSASLVGCKDDSIGKLANCQEISAVVMAKYDLPMSAKVDQSVQDACQRGRGMYNAKDTGEYDAYRKRTDAVLKYASGYNKKMVNVVDDSITAGYMLQTRLMQEAP